MTATVSKREDVREIGAYAIFLSAICGGKRVIIDERFDFCVDAEGCFGPVRIAWIRRSTIRAFLLSKFNIPQPDDVPGKAAHP